MKKVFDRKRCVSNIDLLIKKKGLKVGAVENAIGVSTGYISRLGDSTSKLNLEFLVALSEALEVSLDTLVCYDLSAMTPTELYVYQFCEKVVNQTLYGEMSWEKESIGAINAIKCYSNGTTDHPLFMSEDQEAYYNSYFADDYGTRVTGEVYRTALGTNEWLYLTRVQYPKEKGAGYELYIVEEAYNGTTTNPLCASINSDDTAFNALLMRLYNSVAESCRKVAINASTRSIIDKFMAPDDNDLPF